MGPLSYLHRIRPIGCQRVRLERHRVYHGRGREGSDGCRLGRHHRRHIGIPEAGDHGLDSGGGRCRAGHRPHIGVGSAVGRLGKTRIAGTGRPYREAGGYGTWRPSGRG